MCGISGLWSNTPVELPRLREISCTFNKALRNRGPNNSGCFMDENIGLLMCHTRLSILDLSTEGNQPKKSLSSRYTISFNGEIYNHQFLRSICPPSISFRGSSDTETILGLLDCFGIDPTLELLEGMFSLSIWDSSSQSLYLVRDRFGEKPLYWGNINMFDSNTLFFCSDLQPIFALFPFSRSDVDHHSLYLYFKYGFIPNHNSIHKSFSQVQPGTYLTFKRNSLLSDPLITRYWSPQEQVSVNRMHFNGSHRTAVSHLDTLLRNSISSKLISDVPLACFLSGGIDSSLIASIYSNISPSKITTFNASFSDLNDAYFDESPFASTVADELGTNHFQLDLDSSSVIDNIGEILSSFSEPFSDISQIPTYLISEHVSKMGFKVVLSGDGGDELFGGYRRHIFAYLYLSFALISFHLFLRCCHISHFLSLSTDLPKIHLSL